MAAKISKTQYLFIHTYTHTNTACTQHRVFTKHHHRYNYQKKVNTLLQVYRLQHSEEFKSFTSNPSTKIQTPDYDNSGLQLHYCDGRNCLVLQRRVSVTNHFHLSLTPTTFSHPFTSSLYTFNIQYRCTLYLVNILS
jgi:hypothetical protein